MKARVGVCGCGNMANAFALSWNDRFELHFFDTDCNKSRQFAEKFMGRAAKSNHHLAKNCSLIFLAVKPAHFRTALAEMKDALSADSVIVSIMAGVSMDSIREIAQCDVVRCMPTIAATVGESLTCIDFGGISKEKREVVASMFAESGGFFEVDERDMDAVTAVSGSGIAYAYRFIQSLIESGTDCGLSEECAKRLALSTCVSASKMVRQSDMPITSMVDAVCSKGGTTIAAIEVLNNNSFNSTVREAAQAAFKRAKELGAK